MLMFKLDFFSYIDFTILFFQKLAVILTLGLFSYINKPQIYINKF